MLNREGKRSHASLAILQQASGCDTCQEGGLSVNIGEGYERKHENETKEKMKKTCSGSVDMKKVVNSMRLAHM